MMVSSLMLMPLKRFLEGRIKVVKEEAGTSYFDQAYNKFQEKEETI